MPRLPVLSGRELVKLLSRTGLQVIDQKGSHIILQKFVGGKKLLVVVPNYPEVKIGTLLSIMKQAHLNRQGLETLMKK